MQWAAATRHEKTMRAALSILIFITVVSGQTDFTFRLYSGSSGRLEVFYSNRWGTVCSNGFDNADALIVCNQLNYASGTVTTTTIPGTGPIWMSNISCTGREAFLQDCDYIIPTDCSHSQDVHIQCSGSASQFSYGGERLSGGATIHDGRAEFTYSYTWYTICDYNFDDNDAKAFCNKLGYTTGTAVLTTLYGPGTPSVGLYNPTCSGLELQIYDCSYTYVTSNANYYCDVYTNDKDAGVRCGGSLHLSHFAASMSPYVTESANFNWLYVTSGSQNTYTGPVNGLPTGYMSVPLTTTVSGYKGRIKSAAISIVQNACVIFYYCMYGSNVGQLNVFTRLNSTSASADQLQFRATGGRGRFWLPAAIEVPAPGSLILVFEAIHLPSTRGYSNEIAIAIDAVTVEPGSCGRFTKRYAGYNGCSFELGMCGFDQEKTADQVDWQLYAGPFTGEGPLSDFDLPSTKNGKYIAPYTERVNGIASGDKAQFTTGNISSSTPLCFIFYLQMHGHSTGFLNVYKKKSSSTLLKSLGGGQTPFQEWRNITLDLAADTNFQITFEWVYNMSTRVGTDYDYVKPFIDGVRWIPGPCAGYNFTRNYTTYACDFEATLDHCGWTQERSSDQFDWMSFSGGWKTLYWFPSKDVTYLSTTGHFLAFLPSQVTGRVSGDKAIITSSTYDPESSACFQLYIHAGGLGNSSLNIWLLNSTGRILLKSWKSVDLANTGWVLGTVSVSSSVSFQLQVEGQYFSIPSGDFMIAIDDMKLLSQACPAPANVSTFCDFEVDVCGWEQLQNDSYDWLRWTGSMSYSQTTVDNTFKNGSGHFMTFTPRQWSTTDGINAKVRSPLFTAPADADNCLGFSYTHNGYHLGYLNVYLEQNSIVKRIAWTSGELNPANIWKAMSIPYSVAQGTFRIILEGVAKNDPLNVGNQESFSFDDINVMAQCPNVTNTTSDPRDCDFENLFMCGYRQDKIYDTADWQVVNSASYWGPSYDHTLKNSQGTFAYLNRNNMGFTDGNTIRMLTPTYNNTGPQCVQVYLHMRGYEIGCFNLYLNTSTSNVTKVNSICGAQQGDWFPFSTTIAPNASYSLIFEAQHADKNIIIGSVVYTVLAMDDVSIEDGTCLPEKEVINPMSCDFERPIHLCGFTHDNASYWLWSPLQRSSSVYSTSYSSPLNDHTYKNSSGGFLLSWPIKWDMDSPSYNMKTNRILSSFYQPSAAKCLSFWLHMTGSATGRLSVYLRRQSEALPGTTLVMFDNQQSNMEWINSTLTLDSTESFQIVFEATFIYSSNLNMQYSKIGLDDYLISPDSCSGTQANKTYITFELPLWMYGFSQSVAAMSLVPWSVSIGAVPFPYGPQADHTIGDATGHYMIISTDQTSSIAVGSQAVLLSGSYPATNGSCLTLSYFMDVLHRTEFTVTVQGGNKSTVVFRRVGRQANRWQRADVKFNTSSSYQLSFGVTPRIWDTTYGRIEYRHVAVDDVIITPGSCQDLTSVTCDFESSVLQSCGWTPAEANEIDWMMGQGSQTSYEGPSYDSTYKNATGSYMSFKINDYNYYYNLPHGSVSRTISPTVKNPSMQQHCFAFNMFSNARYAPTLNVYQNTSAGERLLKTVVGNQGTKWAAVQLDVPAAASYQLIIEAEYLKLSTFYTSNSWYGYSIVAIDDLVLNLTACSPSGLSPYSCNFEGGVEVCGFSRDDTDIMPWQVVQSSASYNGPSQDHTAPGSGQFLSFYFYRYGNSYSYMPTVPTTSTLLSSVYPSSHTPKCLELYYWMDGKQVGELRVSLRSNRTGQQSTVILLSGRYSSQWIKINSDLDTTDDYQIIIDATYFPPAYVYSGSYNLESVISIDDFVILDGYCVPSYQMSACDFETNFCGFYQVSNDIDKFDWIYKKGMSSNRASYSLGPSADHTLKTSVGRYLLLDSYDAMNPIGETAIVKSPFYHPQAVVQCVSFWYHMQAPRTGWFNVTLKYDNGASLVLMARNGSQAADWIQFQSVHVDTQLKSFQLIFSATLSYRYDGDVAIDDVSIADGPCGAVSGECNGVVTNFTSNDWHKGPSDPNIRIRHINLPLVARDHRIFNLTAGCYLVPQATDCAMACMLNDQCMSYSFNPSLATQNTTDPNCQLNLGTRMGAAYYYVYHPGWNYYEGRRVIGTKDEL